jgi:hypothetical protein
MVKLIRASAAPNRLVSFAGDNGSFWFTFCYFSGATRSRFDRAVLVLSMLSRPMIAPVLRPSAAPIAPCEFRAAFSSRRCSSSLWLHGLLLFLGIRGNSCQRMILNLARAERFLLSRGPDLEAPPQVLGRSRLEPAGLPDARYTRHLCAVSRGGQPTRSSARCRAAHP